MNTSPGDGMAYVGDLKSPAGNGVRVRLPLRALLSRGLTKNWHLNHSTINLRILSKDTNFNHLPSGFSINRANGFKIRLIIPKIRLLLELSLRNTPTLNHKFIYIQIPGRIIFQIGITTTS